VFCVVKKGNAEKHVGSEHKSHAQSLAEQTSSYARTANGAANGSRIAAATAAAATAKMKRVLVLQTGFLIVRLIISNSTHLQNPVHLQQHGSNLCI
jgi:hypothetical protein